MAGEPKHVGQKTFRDDDWQFFVPASVYVRWPRVVVVPEKRGCASAFILDASKNFEVVGYLPDDQVCFNSGKQHVLVIYCLVGAAFSFWGWTKLPENKNKQINE